MKVGSVECNYRVCELADAVAAELAGTSISINTSARADERSYRVDFSLFAKMAPHHQPQCTVQGTIHSLLEGMRESAMSDKQFHKSKRVIRLNALTALIEDGHLSQDLRWRKIRRLSSS